jgi:hypothetical protein
MEKKYVLVLVCLLSVLVITGLNIYFYSAGYNAALESNIIKIYHKLDNTTKDNLKKVIFNQNELKGLMNECVERSATSTDLFNTVITFYSLSKKYVVDVYDCTEFSDDTTKLLNKHGWEAYSIVTTVNCSCSMFDPITCRDIKNNHKIVMLGEGVLFIEAVTGEVISPSDYECYGLKRYKNED